jgi:integrase
VSVKGVNYRKSLHDVADKPATYVMGKREAQRVLAEWRIALATPIVEPAIATPVEPAIAPVKTFSAVCDDYLVDVIGTQRRPQAHKNATRQVERLRAAFGARPIRDVTTDTIQAWLRAWRIEINERITQKPASRLHAKGGNVGIRRLLARLRHLLNYARDQGDIVDHPFYRNGKLVIIGAEKKTAERSRDRRLEHGEDALIRQHASPHVLDVYCAALSTGMRPGELLALQWRHVRLAKREITIPAEVTKTGEERTIVILDDLVPILERRRIDADGKRMKATAFVFGNAVGERVKSVRTSWDSTLRRAGIPMDLHLHDLRREFGSQIVETGGGIHEAAHWLGHARVSTTDGYLRTKKAANTATAARLNLARKLAQS